MAKNTKKIHKAQTFQILYVHLLHTLFSRYERYYS